MRTENANAEHSRAIREQAEAKPPTPKESPRDARLRTQIERERKEKPMTGTK